MKVPRHTSTTRVVTLAACNQKHSKKMENNPHPESKNKTHLHPYGDPDSQAQRRFSLYSKAPQENAALMEYESAKGLESYGPATSMKVKRLQSKGDKLQQGKNNEAAREGKDGGGMP
ncbi:unnamed protein product [Amoebophrya sp. A25]|nr:unnamed protein product [Amoebophrya sp. A25]|eukprot:GSA25T00008419001.1